MNHNEITTEIELPKKKSGKIIHVNFSTAPIQSSRSTEKKKIFRKPSSLKAFSWLKDFDVRAPWVLRLVAVIAILILSMLIL